MRLECLTVTNDANVLSQVKSALDAYAALLDFRGDATSANELISRRHLDGVFVDCDDLVGGTEAVANVRRSTSNRETIVVAIVNGKTTVEAALDLGANFVLPKPVQANRLQSVLNIAIPKMERDHRRYFRYEIDLPVQLWDHSGQQFAAEMKNLSEGGLAVKTAAPIRLEGVVRVEFDLPSVEPRPFRAKAEIVWSDSFEMGLRFLYIDSELNSVFQRWLRFLEAKSQVVRV
jgi:CheY-like chemotaxis protein